MIPWEKGYDENVKSSSIDILSNDVNKFTQLINGTMVPNGALIKNFCPQNCSNNGVCNENGTCLCNQGWSLVDCSVKLSDPPKIIGLSTKQIFIDNSNSNPKDLIVSLARFVVENPNSTIKVSVMVS